MAYPIIETYAMYDHIQKCTIHVYSSAEKKMQYYLSFLIENLLKYSLEKHS